MVKLDDDKLWDLFVSVFGVIFAEVFRVLVKRLRGKAPRKAGKHFEKEP